MCRSNPPSYEVIPRVLNVRSGSIILFPHSQVSTGLFGIGYLRLVPEEPTLKLLVSSLSFENPRPHKGRTFVGFRRETVSGLSGYVHTMKGPTFV